ncbi:uncharacterized protein TNCV_1673331 [Trichonephila clavipes]|nr:uncharacterized protein TNCV_1673331 [Trichonephila clavipes]
MSRFGGLSEKRPSVFKTRSKPGTHLSTQCSGDERQESTLRSPLIEPKPVWFGPPFLHQYKELEPYDITAVEGDDLFLQELKETSDFPLCALLKNFEPLDIISNCSSFTKLQRVNAWYGDRFNSCQVIYSPFGLAFHQNDHQARRRFAEWAQNEIAAVPDFHKRILFSDEAHFWLNGYVNKQNCHVWSEANPQVYVETPLHPEKLTVWCALWAGGIIGPYFCKNDEGHNVTVNGDFCRAMITIFFIPELNNHDVQELWFQQDGATCHTDRATIDLLKDTFGDRLISRFGPVN